VKEMDANGDGKVLEDEASEEMDIGVALTGLLAGIESFSCGVDLGGVLLNTLRRS
jgi:hypothetical protein